MEKNRVQEQELKHVGGGYGCGQTVPCDKCGKKYAMDEQYPQGFLIRSDRDGCDTRVYFRCPNCGYEWNKLM